MITRVLTLRNTHLQVEAIVHRDPSAARPYGVSLTCQDSGETLPFYFRSDDLGQAVRKAVRWAGIPDTMWDRAELAYRSADAPAIARLSLVLYLSEAAPVASGAKERPTE